MSIQITTKQRKALIAGFLIELVGFIFLVASVVSLNAAPDQVTHEILFWLAVAFSIGGAVMMVIAGRSKRLKSEAN